MRKLFLCSLIILAFVGICFGEGTDVNLLPLDGSIANVVTTLNTTALPIPATALSGRKSIIIQSLSDATIYIGNSTVTADENSTGGIQLTTNKSSIELDVSSNVIIYGRVASDTAKVASLEVR